MLTGVLGVDAANQHMIVLGLSFFDEALKQSLADSLASMRGSDVDGMLDRILVGRPCANGP